MSQYFVKKLHQLHTRLACLELGRNHLDVNMGDINIVDNEQFKKIKKGDDGIIILVTPPQDPPDTGIKYVIKAILSFRHDNPETQAGLDTIAVDQAKREFQALTLLKGHPNVPQILSTELDTCNLTTETNSYVNVHLIRQEFLENISDISLRGFPVMGLSSDDDCKSFFIDFDMRLRLLQYLYGQVASLTKALRDHKIYHRDVDSCNFMIQMPSMRLFLFDFARANMPGLENADELQSKVLKNDSQRVLMTRKRQYVNLNNTFTGCKKLKIDFSTEDVLDYELMCHWISASIQNHVDSTLFQYAHDENITLLTEEFEMKLKMKDNCQELIVYAEPPTTALTIHEKMWNLYEKDKFFWVDKLRRSTKKHKSTHNDG